VNLEVRIRGFAAKFGGKERRGTGVGTEQGAFLLEVPGRSQPRRSSKPGACSSKVATSADPFRLSFRRREAKKADIPNRRHKNRLSEGGLL
jgi:hypothetical protein